MVKYSTSEMVKLKVIIRVAIRGGNREPVSTLNRLQLTNSIGIVPQQRYRFFLTIPARRFPGFLWNAMCSKACVRVKRSNQANDRS